MDNAEQNANQFVFGLDIGTRNVVGTVGYREGKDFYVAAQYMKEHETRAMLDGQIHDIGRVGRTIAEVKAELEGQLEAKLTDVCIAAAGRVLKTVTTSVEYEFAEETVVTAEHIHTLDLLGVDHAQQILKEKNDTCYKFYCVGYSVVKYYINDEVFSNIEGHKAEKISEDVIVTFLPEDVVDGLYSAVGQAGLNVANLTLEPIAAINVAIPEAFRMLNIALVDVGAGTSDICVTRDGSIIAYGMIPYAGDELTELIVQHYLVDFNMAEHMKLTSGMADEVEFTDIMSITHTIPSEEIWNLTHDTVDKITTEVAEKIKELNGDKSVSAAFVVGGGGKIHGFTEMLADKLEIPRERVALRGEEVLKEVHFAQEEIKKDPLLVTPIGICLNYYDQKNNFIMVRFNGERLKLYDNSHLTIVDAALQAGFPNEALFPRRGKAVEFTVNGKPRIVRGEPGESAIVKVDGRVVSINTPLVPNSEITIEASTIGKEAVSTIEQLDEYTSSTITFQVNGINITCPKFVQVNGSLEPSNYVIQEGDEIETRNFYTIGQLAEFMDVRIDEEAGIILNGKPADMGSLCYENFEIEWSASAYESGERHISYGQADHRFDAGPEEASTEESTDSAAEVHETEASVAAESVTDENAADENAADGIQTAGAEPAVETNTDSAAEAAADAPVQKPTEPESKELHIIANNQEITLSGKEEYVFVDIFDYIDFDLSASHGRAIVTLINGVDAQYTQVLQDGDKIEVYWKENY